MPKFIYGILVSIAILALVFFVIRPFDNDPSSTEEPSSNTEETPSVEKNLPTIVLDAGHGGFDPGKVGVNDVLEKDINLAIVQKLKPLLEEYGFTIYLTRDSDEILGPANSTRPKMDDMIARVDMVKELNPYFTISIHQNSYTSPEVNGPQVFYYKDSVESATMAQIIQNAMNQYLEPQKKREPQANANYYLLTRTPTPTVIVECGFLSNPNEAELLSSEEYQNKVAQAIYMGIVSYYETNSLNQTPTE
ncbi:MAG: N-acetylmuramoyl-L-alanine amidase [Agathobacter sp.]|nr:N-acetylmuramoyl-L-alanine amidase [Agathobacter sp.]